MYRLDEKILEKINLYYDRCKKIADYLTDHPEVSGTEEKAVRAITSLLKEEGYGVTAPYLDVKHSFLAVKKELKDKAYLKAVILCEYDALPDIGHACGHSISCAVSLLAALAFSSAYPEIPLRIDIMGTPAEEFPGGKIFLAEAGAFDDYEFAAMAHMFHVNSPNFNVLACTDRYITFKGKNSHASASPCDGLNALNGARIFMDAMDMWRQHLPATSQIHGIIEKGGELPSIVPDHVELNYYFRAKNTKDLDDLLEKTEEAVKGAALCTGTEFEMVQRYPTYADLYSGALSLEVIKEIFSAMGKEAVTFDAPQGSTDAGNVDQLIPVFHPLISATGGKYIALHDPEFAKQMKSEAGYKGLYNGGVLVASLLHRLSTEEGLLKEIQADHRRYREKLA